MSALRITIAALLAAPGVSAAVGARVYPFIAPQGSAWPHIIVGLVSEDDEQMLSGAGLFFDARVEVACIATSATAADALGEAVKVALQDVTNQAFDDGELPPGFSAVATILKDGADVSDYSDDLTVFRRIMDFRVRWQ